MRQKTRRKIACIIAQATMTSSILTAGVSGGADDGGFTASALQPQTDTSTFDMSKPVVVKWLSGPESPECSDDASLHFGEVSPGPPINFVAFWFEGELTTPENPENTRTTYCYQKNSSYEDIYHSVESEFKKMNISGSNIIVEPDRDDYIIHLPVSVYTTPRIELLETTVLSIPVTIRARPGWFSWDWGDQSEILNTQDPGAPYPDHTISHTYKALGDFHITMTTTWHGDFSLDGGTSWIPINETVTSPQVSKIINVGEGVPLLTG